MSGRPEAKPKGPATEATVGDTHAVEAVAHDILLRGVRVHYVVSSVAGHNEKEERAPLLALHGLGRSARQWSLLARALAPKRRVIALDFPGFGESERPPQGRWKASYEALAETTLDLLAALDLGRVALVGHSIGAAAAIVAAADRPEHFEKLVLVAPPCFTRATPLADRLLAMPVLGPALFRRMIGRATLDRHHASARGSITPTDASFEFLRRMSDPATLEARLSRLRTPTLVLWGRNDRVIPQSHGARLARAIDAQLEILDCGHNPESERAQLFAELVESFLASDGTHHRGVVRTPRPERRRELRTPSRVDPDDEINSSRTPHHDE